MAAEGYEANTGGQGAGQESPDAAGYLSWARYLLNAEGEFVPLREAFPELGGKDKPFDSVMATVSNGEACIFAFKIADSLSYTQIVWHLNQLLDMVPKASALATPTRATPCPLVRGAKIPYRRERKPG